MLRTIGASSRQVLRAVFLEALLIGVVSSILGILAGIYVVATFLLLISERSRVWASAPYSRER